MTHHRRTLCAAAAAVAVTGCVLAPGAGAAPILPGGPVTVPILDRPNVGVSVTHPAGRLTVRDAMRETITVTNTSRLLPATGVWVASYAPYTQATPGAALPAGCRLVGTYGQGDYAETLCQVGTLAPRESRTLTVSRSVDTRFTPDENGAGRYGVHTQAGATLDTYGADSQADDTFTLNADAALALGLEAPTIVEEGATVPVTVRLRNDGPDSVRDPHVVVTLADDAKSPAQQAAVFAVDPGSLAPGCTYQAALVPQVTCTVPGRVAVGASVTLQIRVRTTAVSGGETLTARGMAQAFVDPATGPATAAATAAVEIVRLPLN